MFTRQQIIEWFSDRYTEQQVIEALRIMADNGADVNPDGDQFSPDITEELEKIFDAVGAAIDNQKKLPQSQQSESGLVASATQLAATASPHVNPQMMAAMIRTVIESSVSEATALVQLRAKVVERVLTQGNMEITRSLRDEATKNASYLQNLANDSNRIDTLLTGYGIGDTAQLVEAFLEETRSGTAQTKANVKSARAAAESIQTSDDDFINAFLMEAGA